MKARMHLLARGSYASLALLQALCFAQPARAQAQSDKPDIDIAPEIIVTAQFRAQKLQDTPLAITAVNASTLAARSQTSIVDLGSFAPNVNLSGATAINSNSITAYIRGIGQDDASFALEPGVGIYVDDVYYGTTFGAALDLVDLARAEVLRGPQGTLAGKNSLGGAIKLFSAKPEAANTAQIEAGTGSFGRINLRGSANAKLTDSLFARVSGTYDKRRGYFHLIDYGCANPASGVAATTSAAGCETGRQGGVDVLSLRGALRYAPAGSPLEINLSGDFADNRSELPATKLTFADTSALAPSLATQAYRTYTPGNPFAGVPFGPAFMTPAHSYTSYESFSGAGNYTTIFGFPAQVAPGTFPDAPQNSAKSWGGTAQLDYKLGDSLALKSITAWRGAKGTTIADIDGTPISIIKERFTNKHQQFTQELRLTGNAGTLADFTVGAFYYKAHDRSFNRIMIPTFQYDFIADDRSNNRSIAGFANLELHPLAGLNVIAGVRYTDDKKTYDFARTNIDGSAISGIPFTLNWLVFGLDGLSGTFQSRRWDYRIGVNYRFNPSLMVYAQVSTGYKGGGVNPRPFAADQVRSFSPESVTTYEAGFKSNQGGLFILNAAAFYNAYKNIQRTQLVCPASISVTCSMPVNAGSGHSQGVEIEAQLHPVNRMTIEGSVGYLDFKYENVNALTLISPTMTAPFNAKWNASASVQYAADLGQAGSITPRLDWSYQSSFFYNAVNSPLNLVAGRGLLNARITWSSADTSWAVSGGVTNLANKFYYTAVSENAANFGLTSSVVGRPREFSISLKRKF